MTAIARKLAAMKAAPKAPAPVFTPQQETRIRELIAESVGAKLRGIKHNIAAAARGRSRGCC